MAEQVQEQNEKKLTPIEVAKVIFQTGAQVCEDYEEDTKLDIEEAKDNVFNMFTKLWEEYNDDN